MSKEILNVEEAAGFLGFSPYMIREYARTGQIPATKIGREWRFSKESLIKHVQGTLVIVVLERYETMWAASSPQYPGTVTEGKDVPEALEMMADAWRLMDEEVG